MLALRKEFIGKGGWKYAIHLVYDVDTKTFKVVVYTDKESGGILLGLHAIISKYSTCEAAVTILLNFEHYYRTGFHPLKGSD